MRVLEKIDLPYIVIIKGAGDLATGVAHRLWMAGFRLLMLDLPRPLVVRRSVAFAAAIMEGTVEVEGLTASLAFKTNEIDTLWRKGKIPVFVDPKGELVSKLRPQVLVDAVMAKKNTGTSIEDAPIVLGLGPGLEAGKDVHAVVETKRGQDLGRAIYSGFAAENTGMPGEVGKYSGERLLRAPETGKIVPLKEIGALVKEGEMIALINNEVPISAGISGLLRGMIYPGMEVQKGMKVGDIDPRGSEVDYKSISDKARAVAGGALEAAMHLLTK